MQQEVKVLKAIQKVKRPSIRVQESKNSDKNFGNRYIVVY